MRFVGTCPHCQARLELAAPPPPLLTCDVCAGRCMVVMPESAGEESGGEVEVAVLPCKEEHARPSRLASRGLRRPILIGLIAACALAVAFLAVGLLHLFAPESSFTGSATMAFVIAAGLLFVALPLSAVLSLVVIWFLFGRRGRSAPDFDLTRSVLAVTAGVATLMVAGFLLFSLRMWIEATLPVSLSWSISIACDIVAGLGAGWVTVRLSPNAPYRHAIGVGVVLVLGIALLVLPSAAQVPRLPIASTAYLVFVPVLLLGAWIGVRSGHPSAGPREAG